MLDQRARNAVSASAVTLVLTAVSGAFFLQPLHRYISHSTAMIALIGLLCCISMVMHFFFVGLAARRLGRNAALWVVLAILFFPITSIVGLVLLEWFSDEKAESTTAS